MQRTIFHVDMDAFFVSVEELRDPSLKGKPVVVGGRPDERGVVSAASYAALKFGVHSAMPLRTAYKLCPQAIFLDGHPERYREASLKVRAVLESFSPQVEMASIDEAYLDMTGTERLHGPPLRSAHLLHEKVKRETELNCSIGIGSSRLVAKISSDQGKPNGICYVLAGCEQAFLAPLEVRKIPGVGKVTERTCTILGSRPLAISLSSTTISWKKNSASGAWRWRASRAAKMPAATSKAASRIPRTKATRNPSAMSTLFPRTRAIPSFSSQPWRGSPKWWRDVCAITACARGMSH